MAELKKVLSYKTILLITINSIIGTGIFFLPAFGAVKAGPASILSWFLLSLVSIYISMCFAELVGMFPFAGGIYEYSKQAYGRFTSFIIGWATVIAGNVTIAMLIVGAISYLLPFEVEGLKLKLIVTLISIGFIIAFNYIAYRGMDTSAFMLVTFAVITIATLFILIIPGHVKIGSDLAQGNTQNFSPFFVFPISMIFITIFFIAETFFGWETATFLAEETKDPEHVMPKALIHGTIIIAVICMLFAITTVGVIPLPAEGWEKFPADRPLADLAKTLKFGNFGVDIVTILVYLSIIGSVAGWVVSAPRLILALCRDKLFPGHLGVIHEKYGTPYKAIIFQTFLTSALIVMGVGSYHSLLRMLLPIALLLYAAVVLSLVVLRYKMPDHPRPYRQPFGVVGPILLAIYLLSLIVLWVIFEHGALQTLLLALSFILIGIPVYFMVEMYYDQRFIRKIIDYFAYLTLMTEFIFIPRKIVNQALVFVGDVEKKKVLEFGCGVGTITKELAQKIGPKGILYASDVSLKQLNLTEMRLKNRSLNNVKLVHDEMHSLRVHPTIPKVDAVISMGMLSYVQDTANVLKQLNARLKNGNKICFVDYSRFFHVIPNVEWLCNNDEIIKIFNSCGYSITILRKHGLLFDYIFIYGIKSRKKKLFADIIDL